MAVITIYDTSSDGFWGEVQNASWTTTRDTASHAVTSPPDAGNQLLVEGWNNTFSFSITRSAMIFDTSVLGAGAVVTSATLTMTVKANGIGNGNVNYFVKFGGNIPFDSNGYNKTNFGATFSANYGTLASTGNTLNAQLTLPTSANLVNDINVSGNTPIGIVTDNDYTNTTPSANASAQGNNWYANQAGTAKAPFLTVTYTPASGVAGYKSLKGVGQA